MPTIDPEELERIIAATATTTATATTNAMLQRLGLPADMLSPDASAQAGPPDRLLSKAEVLHWLGITYPTLWQMIRVGRFPPARYMESGMMRGRPFWKESELNAFVDGLPLQATDANPNGYVPNGIDRATAAAKAARTARRHARERAQADADAAAGVVKRGRGRPRKVPPAGAAAVPVAAPAKAKGRGK